jgi:hypothetical protein
VHSLRTPATYSLVRHDTGAIVANVTGYAHMEKNWGAGFPSSWLWSQGQGIVSSSSSSRQPSQGQGSTVEALGGATWVRWGSVHVIMWHQCMANMQCWGAAVASLVNRSDMDVGAVA